MKGIGEDVELGEEYAVVLLPNNKDGERNVTLYVPGKEAAILNEALDKLPWTFLSWSIHRGLRDLLVAFAKERMDSYRTRLADTLRFAVFTWPERLDARGWDSRFVRENMADLAASAILAGQGNSGDAVRIVTDIATIMWDGDISALDETKLWRDSVSKPCSSALSPMDVTALVKCFVLEWSMDLNYQMYHDFPMELYLV
ncbi:hypothetical protein N7462_008212 [Penicillium macrosclerotiorum]|uniref:uncharacterized protein n=1 Tax=Penicillium macrosclerotiorum TaxID=303699 RepID=UPI002549396B|nr:uncharacterized protein N7462_008212 [Penicillium macrosclerotiorum]KAJ5679968.1 hypothetical protein N7462_008212 [Penicillium macrosclerotiorum]